jgi:hypothetical protein
MEENQFYRSRRIDRYPPEGVMNTCKKCLTMFVDNWDPETFKPILEDVDVPYIEEEWNKLLEKYSHDPKKLTGATILGRYLAKMKLKQYSNRTWDDSEAIAEELKQKKLMAMKAQGFSETEITKQLNTDRTPVKPKELAEAQSEVGPPQFSDSSSIDDEFSDQLTEEDKTMLSLKWGKSYTCGEWVRMEQLYQDMMSSYDIQTAGHKDNLIMLCKTSLKANQLLDAGDIEGA